MADQTTPATPVVVHIGENSPERVAQKLAENILFQIEGKRWNSVTRQDYLMTVYQCLQVLQGNEPHIAPVRVFPPRELT